MTGFNPIHDFLDASLRYAGGDKKAFKKYKKQQAKEEKYKVKRRTSWDRDNEIFLDGNDNPWVWDSKQNATPMNIAGNKALDWRPKDGKPLPLPGQGRGGTEILGPTLGNQASQTRDRSSVGSRITSSSHRDSIASRSRQHSSRFASSPCSLNRLAAESHKQRSRALTPEHDSAPTNTASLPRVSAVRSSGHDLLRSKNESDTEEETRPALPHSATAPASTTGNRKPTALGGWLGDMNRTIWEGLNTPSEMASNERRADRSESGNGNDRVRRHGGRRSA